jgi:two-component system OmpR family sensor kinase
MTQPLEPRAGWWRRNPLRVRLVAAMLALVAFALAVIGTASAFALHSYMIDRIDSQLSLSAAAARTTVSRIPPGGKVQVLFPTDFAMGFATSDGQWDPSYDDMRFKAGDLPAVATDAHALDEHLDVPYTAVAVDGQYRWRVLITKVGQNTTLVLGQNLNTVDSAMGRLILVEVLVSAGVLIALGLMSVWVVRASLRPLAAIERTAGAIAGGDLTQRVPELDPHTELGQLSTALNTMLGQIEAAFLARKASEARAVRSEERMRQFVADASHELRTPLTTIRGFAELYRQGAAPDPADVLRRIEDEAARMGLLVEDLLMLARLDQERPIQLGPVPLPPVIADAAAAAHAVAPDRHIDLDIGQSSEGFVVEGDEARLRQVVGNLVTNAITHTPPGSPVTLRLKLDGEDHALIEVSDEGPGLSPEQAEHVFERFYRVDKARTRKASAPAPRGADPSSVPHSGAGLGLAIVSALVAAHNGTVAVRTAPGHGATFEVRLPLARTSQ